MTMAYDQNLRTAEKSKNVKSWDSSYLQINSHSFLRFKPKYINDPFLGSREIALTGYIAFEAITSNLNHHLSNMTKIVVKVKKDHKSHCDFSAFELKLD